jgi:hypothetical protein
LCNWRDSHKKAQKHKTQEIICASCAFLWRELRLSAKPIGGNMKESKVLKRVSYVAAVIGLAVICIAAVKTTGQEENSGDGAAGEQWEYLSVAGPSNANFQPTTTPRMRKEPNTGFGREAFVLEQHLDRLGANGWELITVTGAEKDPVFYFKRRRRGSHRE